MKPKLKSTHSWVSCRKEDDKRRRQIDVLVSEGDEDTSSSPADLSVQNWVQDRVVTFYILQKEEKTMNK